jgi:hypothetical protein
MCDSNVADALVQALNGALQTCRVGAAFLAEVAGAECPGYRPELERLWVIAGKPKNRSPRRWLAGRSCYYEGRIDFSASAGGGVRADFAVLFDYLRANLDDGRRIGSAWEALLDGGLVTNPGPFLTQPDRDLIALLAKSELMGWRLLDDAAATRFLLDRVVIYVKAQGLGMFEEETPVARAQRALRAFRCGNSLPKSGGDGADPGGFFPQSATRPGGPTVR